MNFRDLFLFTRSEVDDAFSKAKALKRGRGLTLLSANSKKNDEKEPFEHGRLLIIISRKVGKAHDRNLLRRRIKAIFYENKLYQKPQTLILITYKPAIDLTFDNLKDFFISAIR